MACFGPELKAHLGRMLPSGEDAEDVLQQVWITVAFAFDIELVEMGVGPSHYRLDMLMELVQRAVLDLNSPPDRWLGTEQRDLELEHGVCGGFWFRLSWQLRPPDATGRFLLSHRYLL